MQELDLTSKVYLSLWVHLSFPRGMHVSLGPSGGWTASRHYQNLGPNSLTSCQLQRYTYCRYGCTTQLTDTAPNIQDSIQLGKRGEGQVMIERQQTQVVLEDYSMVSCVESLVHRTMYRLCLSSSRCLVLVACPKRIVRSQQQEREIGPTSSTGSTYFPSLYPWYFRPFSSMFLKMDDLREAVEEKSDISCSTKLVRIGRERSGYLGYLQIRVLSPYRRTRIVYPNFRRKKKHLLA